MSTRTVNASPNKVNDTKRDYMITKIIMISMRELIARDIASDLMFCIVSGM